MPKILLAEDDTTMVSLLKTLLTMEGFEVANLLDFSGDILQNIAREKPDVLLLDVYLGDQNGIDILSRMRKAPDLQGVKVIMASGINMEAECLEAGANSFLLKPYMPEDLLLKLRS